MNVESIVYDLFQELTTLRERVYELERVQEACGGRATSYRIRYQEAKAV